MGTEHVMTCTNVPSTIASHYECHQWRHACTILQQDFPAEWQDIVDVLSSFTLPKSLILAGGKNKSRIATSIDSAFYSRGWLEKQFETKIQVDGVESDSPTHKVDCFRNRVALELEWSNKDPFFDRDLNNFRLLFELRAVSVGVIITKADELADLFRALGVYSKYGASTTWMKKLIPRIEGGGGGGCPILAFGIKNSLYDPTT